MDQSAVDPVEVSDGLPKKSIEAVYAVAYSLFESQRTEEAARAFRVMLRFAPTDERGWLGLGTCHEELDQEELASELFGAGAAVSEPPSARCYVALARIERRNRNVDAAEQHLEEAARLAEEADDIELLRAIRAESRKS